MLEIFNIKWHYGPKVHFGNANPRNSIICICFLFYLFQNKNLFPQERSPTPLYYPPIIPRGQPPRLYYEDVTNFHDQISHPLTSSHGFHHPTNSYHLNDQVNI